MPQTPMYAGGSTMNPIDDPWIPVVSTEGRSQTVGLRDALLRAHEIRNLAAPPLERVAILRLLLAVLHRALRGPRTPEVFALSVLQQGDLERRALIYVNDHGRDFRKSGRIRSMPAPLAGNDLVAVVADQANGGVLKRSALLGGPSKSLGKAVALPL